MSDDLAVMQAAAEQIYNDMPGEPPVIYVHPDTYDPTMEQLPFRIIQNRYAPRNTAFVLPQVTAPTATEIDAITEMWAARWTAGELTEWQLEIINAVAAGEQLDSDTLNMIAQARLGITSHYVNIEAEDDPS